MGIFQKIIKRLPFTTKGYSRADAETFRLDFKTRYHAFKRLLAANQKSLEIMADIELKLSGDHVFGMPFVRRSCTTVSVNVLRMINHLNQLSNGRYRELDSRFSDLQAKIEILLTGSDRPCSDGFILDINAVDRSMVVDVGSKMANLAEIKNKLNIRIPEGFIITAAAYDTLIQFNDLQTEIDRRCQAANVEKLGRLNTLSSELQQLIVRAKVPETIHQEIMVAWKKLSIERGKDVKIAMRSSALGEDSATNSFAGQYRSVLNVDKESIIDIYKEILASKYTPQAIAYRLNRGIRDEDVSMCVGCMEMVPGISGGVVYTTNPVSTGNDNIHISATWGLPKIVVDGKAASDLYVIDRTPPLSVIRREIADKKEKFVCFEEAGVCRMELTDNDRNLPALTAEQAISLARVALEIEDYYQTPQDIEWTIERNGHLQILQCRPLHNSKSERNRFVNANQVVENEVIFEDRAVTASSGIATGRVFRLDKHADMLRFPQGAVLVTRQALPVWASLLNRAAAIVTEEGGFAGHLASVAREFEVPALFGIPGIMNILQDNEQVTVDADQWIIWKGKVKNLPKRKAINQDIISNSLVYATLQQISRYIVPLNFLDPDAIEFAPHYCRTLHDITRFIHEKSVHEMFSFGKSHDFPERSSKQLHHNVPMQWWILNLDDGFNEDVKGKYIHFDNICSIPMLAFWKGYTAVPWEGPPPVDGKGMMSVMFRSTMNPALSVGVRSRYADRNYFMVSKNYCNLSSRLGYHFATMEALISKRVAENYVSFQFKGGAADYNRRSKRVAFIQDILEESGFRVELRKDNLIARVEGFNPNYMTERVKILGYLAQHTRQLDMIMTNPSIVNHYKSKFERDIGDLV
ncbi:MAG: pyruvate, water dikinase [Desulfobacterales bacterium]|nr:pyruvate, water dikinase [Desulfobacterales bacterium]